MQFCGTTGKPQVLRLRLTQKNASNSAQDDTSFTTNQLLTTTLYVDTALISAEVIEEGLHFACGVSVVGALGGGEACFEASGGFFRAALFGKGLSGHLVRGDVVGIEFDKRGEFS